MAPLNFRTFARFATMFGDQMTPKYAQKNILFVSRPQFHRPSCANSSVFSRVLYHLYTSTTAVIFLKNTCCWTWTMMILLTSKTLIKYRRIININNHITSSHLVYYKVLLHTRYLLNISIILVCTCNMVYRGHGKPSWRISGWTRAGFTIINGLFRGCDEAASAPRLTTIGALH